MNETIKKRWLKALRSDEYVQGKGALCVTNSEDKFCCLGVLCNVRAEGSKTLYWKLHDSDELMFSGEYLLLSKSMLSWADLTEEQQSCLANQNDGGDSFEKIANYIEENL